jgi:hypothetical protein
VIVPKARSNAFIGHSHRLRRRVVLQNEKQKQKNRNAVYTKILTPPFNQFSKSLILTVCVTSGCLTLTVTSVSPLADFPDPFVTAQRGERRCDGIVKRGGGDIERMGNVVKVVDREPAGPQLPHSPFVRQRSFLTVTVL